LRHGQSVGGGVLSFTYTYVGDFVELVLV